MSVSRVFRFLGVWALLWGSLGRAAPVARAAPPAPPAVEAPGVVSVPAADPATWPAGCGGLLATINSTSPRPILDPGRLTSTITMTTAATFIWNVTVTTTITSTQPSDLEIYLISPQGTEVTLSSNNGGSLQGVFNGVLWSDQAGLTNPPGAITDNALVNGVAESPVAPEEALGALYGENPNGGWKLVIVDNVDNGSTGTRLNWAVNVEALATVPYETSWTENFAAPRTITDGAQLMINKHFGLLRDWPISRVVVSTTISHTNSGDLSVYLKSPGGISTTLTTGNGGSLDQVFRGTLWDDTAGATNPPGAITDSTLAEGVAENPAVPEEAMSAFRGDHAAWGSWQLVITDAANSTGGTLEAASFTVRQATCLPDLEVGIPYEIASPIAGHAIEYHVNVINYGVAATGGVYTQTIPSVARFLGMQAEPGWACTAPPAGGLGGQVTCSHGPMPFGVVYHPVSVTLGMPAVPQVFTQTFQVDVNGADAAASNDSGDYVQSAAVVSANGNRWDVQDALWRYYPYYGSSGALTDGGQGAFNWFGNLRLYVITETAQLNYEAAWIEYLGLRYSPGHRWTTTTPVFSKGEIEVTRSLYAPVGANYLRYLDSFTNHAALPRTVYVAWGGSLRTYTGTYVAGSSSGDTTLSASDTWGVTRSGQAPNPAEEPPVGYALRSAGDTSFWGPGVYNTYPITTPYAGGTELSFVFRLELAPGETESLAYFLYRGLEEGTPGPDDCDFWPDYPCRTPAAGTEVAAAISAVEALAATPDFCDLSGEARARIVNWPGAQLACQVFLPGALK